MCPGSGRNMDVTRKWVQTGYARKWVQPRCDYKVGATWVGPRSEHNVSVTRKWVQHKCHQEEGGT